MKLLKKNKILKNGEIANIFYNNNLVGCNATRLILQTAGELIEKGFSIENSIGIFDSAEVIWAECNNIPIGGICYCKQLQGVSAGNWIILSFTDPEWRGLNVNYICHKELEKLTIADGMNQITSLVHVNNIARIESCKKVGMSPKFYRMNQTLKIE